MLEREEEESKKKKILGCEQFDSISQTNLRIIKKKLGL